MAFYRVEFDGREIAPGIADRFDISLNEIWMSEKLQPYEKYVLHHELQEIKHRPYFDLEELKQVKGIGKQRFQTLTVECWCL